MGCRARRPKSDLLRLVRTPEGSVRVDVTGAAEGRGAYVHRDPSCVRLAMRKGALARALRARLGPEDLATLLLEMEREMERA